MTIEGSEQRRLSLPSLPLTSPQSRTERKRAHAELVRRLGFLDWTDRLGWDITEKRKGWDQD